MDALLARVDTYPSRGLASSVAADRLRKHGPNEILAPPGPSSLRKLLAQFANPIVLTLLVAAVIAIVDGASRPDEPMLVRFGDAIAILLIVALNAVLGFVQEQRAEAALDALQRMQTPRARVRRDGEVRVVPAPELVVGDVARARGRRRGPRRRAPPADRSTSAPRRARSRGSRSRWRRTRAP